MKLTIREMAVFGMLGAVMYASKFVMEMFPNIHLLGVFTVAFTASVRTEFTGYAGMDCCGSAMGYAAWYQQFFLRNSDYADYYGIEACGGRIYPRGIKGRYKR